MGVDSSLSSGTARLSISTVDIEQTNPRLEMKELLRTELANGVPRRDSAVSINEEEEDTSISHEKRRRSSVQSIINGEHKKEKKHKKKLKKQNQQPQLELNLDVKSNGEVKRFPFHNLRSLVLYTFGVSVGTKLPWLSMTGQDKIPTVCFCIVPGLELEEDSTDKTQTIVSSSLKQFPELQFLYDTFPQAIKSITPGSKDSIYSPLQSITNIPLTKNEKKTILENSKRVKITINDLLMTPRDMISHNYPQNLKDNSWRETQLKEGEDSHIFALDCEFCKAGTEQVLTRASLVDFEGNVVFDELVKPKQEITDYVTKYSGITQEKLVDVTTTLDQIQQLFLDHISAQDILVGHSLESDLQVLRIKHGKIVDTSIIYEHNRGPPAKPSLKWLALKYLNREIQAGEETGEGHSSIEDAKASLDLVKLKIIEGNLFGINVNEVSIFKRLASTQGEDFKSLWISYCQYKDQESYVEPEEYHVDRIYVNNDDEVIDQFQSHCQDKRFVVLQLRELEYNNKWSSIPQHYNQKLDLEQPELYQRTGDRLQKIYEQLPENSLFILYTQSKSPLAMYKLQEIRQNFQKLQKDGIDVTKLTPEESWDFDKLQELTDKTAIARQSLSFIKLKQS
ncbi:RNA exonuclease 1 [Spathaspora sp. JA1]|nr:RNA exonuclease 1 [Spathaspora sp. JA1]